MTGSILARSSAGASRLAAVVGAIVTGLGCLAGGAARAELVILESGSFFKVERYAIDRQQQIRLELPSGGVLLLPLSRIDRIVDDEILPAAEPPLSQPTLKLEFESSAAVPDTPYGELIYATAERHSMHPDLVAAVIAAESAFDPRAVSVKGARGLMQLMPATAERFGVAAERLFEPSQNLEAGVRYLSWLVDRFQGDPASVLAAYNSGEGTVERYGGVPPYRETRDYLRRVYRRLGFSAEELLGK